MKDFLDGIENDFDSLSIGQESELSSDERKELPDSSFGLPGDRKYPLYDKKGKPLEAQIKSAISYFHKCKDAKKKKILANNIYKAVKQTSIEYSKDDEWYTYVDASNKAKDKKEEKKK